MQRPALIVLLIFYIQTFITDVMTNDCPVQKVDRIVWTDDRFMQLSLVQNGPNPLKYNLSLDVLRLIESPTARLELSFDGPKKRSTFLNRTIDICSLVFGKKSDFFLWRNFAFLSKSESMPKECPVPIVGPPPMEGHAVVVWLHSGDFSSGHSTELDPFQLVFKQKVIMVTVSYRLNIFGFLSTMDGESPGNFGLMDQSAALLWIRRNIKIFGGNASSITLLGHGAGSQSAGLHLFSGEWTDGLFHRVIMMSGSPLVDTAIHSPFMFDTFLESIANAHSCPRHPTSMLVDCLRKLDAQVLAENTPDIDWKPVMDNGLSNSTTPFLADYPRNLLERGQFRYIPLLIGFTDMEEVMDVLSPDMMEMGITSEMYETLLPDSLLEDLSYLDANDTSTCSGRLEILFDSVAHTYMPYPAVTDPLELRNRFVDFHTERKYMAPSLMLANHMSHHATTYVYRFDIRPQTFKSKSDVPDWVGVPHNFDLIFIWGMPYWSNQEMLNIWESADKRVADIVMTLWVNFAKFMNPTKFGVYIKWDEFMEKEHQVLIIDRAFNMSDKRKLDLHGVGYWIDHYPKAMALATQCCNASAMSYFSNPTNNVILKVPIIIALITITIFAFSPTRIST